jgi:hypothetical protein
MKRGENLKIEKIDNTIIDNNSIVKVTTMGNVIHKQYMEKRNSKQSILKLDKDHYIKLTEGTGEIYECNHIENRSQGLNSLRSTLRALKGIVNNNVVDYQKCRWVTLTYAENMTDDKKLQVDLKHCIKRLRDKFGEFEYIAVREPQGRGAWHFHLFFIFDNKAPYISNNILSECWKKGYVTIKKINDDCDDIGSYFTAYLCDIEYDQANDLNLLVDGTNYDCKDVETEDENGKKISKKIIKGGRLCLYPPGMNLYTFSKGIKKPVSEMMTEKKAQKKISSAKLTFQNAIKLTDETTKFDNIIINQYYNIKR